MNIRRYICFLALISLTGCAHSGYSPSYIISDAEQEVSCDVQSAQDL